MPQVLHTLVGKLYSLFSQATHMAFPQVTSAIEIAKSKQDSFGHYQFNSAMKLAKELKINPRQVAEKILSAYHEHLQDPFVIKKLEVAGPGFINITLNEDYLQQEVLRMLNSANLGCEARCKEKIVIDFSSPNTAKEMHVGHLRSTIIGDCLAKTFEFLGHDVVRLNHIGDWGTAFGMLIAYIKQHTSGSFEQMTLSELVNFYRKAKQLFDEDLAFKKAAQLEVVALQGGQEAALQVWRTICDISRKAYQEIYDLLGVQLIERGESFYNPLLADVVRDLQQKNLITVSDGAKCIFLEGFQNREGNPLPLMIQKSDGGYNYDTTDMAAMRQRVDAEKASRIIIVTDAGQATHFQMIFLACQKANYLDPQKVRFDHVPFGLVLGNDGKKFRTRSGETEKLIDLIFAAIDQATAILNERNSEWTEEERKMIGRHLGINAIKYSDLSSHRLSDYVFSYEKMLRFEGNTAAFIMYSYVRVQGIQRKCGVNPEELLSKASLVLEHPTEVALGLHIAQFAEVIDHVAEDLLPNRLTDYLYGLAEAFNVFFRDCRVEGTKEQNSRLLLCEATARVIKQGMSLLGLTTVSKM